MLNYKSIIMKKILIVFFLGLLLQSCSTSTIITAKYLIGLSSVESPANSKQQFGETKIINLNNDSLNKYRYIDEHIDVVWYVSSKQFDFELTNKSEHRIKINWDDISYVDFTGKTGRVMHSGIKYSEKNNSQPAITIPPNAFISDILIPTDNVKFSAFWECWYTTNLIPSRYDSQEEFDAKAGSYIGKSMIILMPIIIEDVQNEYIFEFRINGVIKDVK